MTRHTVMYGTNQSSQYTSGYPARADTTARPSCTAMMDRALRRVPGSAAAGGPEAGP